MDYEDMDCFWAILYTGKLVTWKAGVLEHIQEGFVCRIFHILSTSEK